LIHPISENLKALTDNQIEQKIYRLNGIYFMTDNASVRQQIILLLDGYKLELETRRVAAKKNAESDNSDLDGLIKVS
jgi:hypothetical protein